MKVYIIDNYDSFTYNLYQFVGEILESEQRLGSIKDFDVVVKRNDEVTLEEVRQAMPDRIVISPGPGTPDDPEYFGVCAQVIAELGKTIPLMGVCLGMQGICHVFGGKIIKASLPMHGKTSPISHNGEGIFYDIPDQLEIMRYHSLMAEEASLPDVLEITAKVSELTKDNPEAEEMTELMGIRHKNYPIQGIQFHPESFATEGGKDLIRNFLLQM